MKKVFLALLLFLVSSCGSHGVNLTKSLNKENHEYYTITSDWFRFKNPTEDIPFTVYVQYIFEKTKLANNYVVSLKFEGYQFPRISEINVDIDSYSQKLDIVQNTIYKNEGVRGISETIFFGLTDYEVEEMILAKKVFFIMKGLTDYRFFLSKEAIDVLSQFYDKTIEEK